MQFSKNTGAHQSLSQLFVPSAFSGWFLKFTQWFLIQMTSSVIRADKTLHEIDMSRAE
jgi:hypothetical protein